MGAEFQVNSLEDMCEAMCNNNIPTQEQKNWIFTFGSGQLHEGHYVKIFGTYEEARLQMFERYGDQWGFQYSEEEWNNWLNERPKWCPVETELEG